MSSFRNHDEEIQAALAERHSVRVTDSELARPNFHLVLESVRTMEHRDALRTILTELETNAHAFNMALAGLTGTLDAMVVTR